MPRCRSRSSCRRSRRRSPRCSGRWRASTPRMLARYYKQAAKKSGECGKLHAGAVTFVQRFGSSLNLHVLLCALDGQGEEAEAPRFVPRALPSRAELCVLAERIALRVMTWLRKRGHAEDATTPRTTRRAAPSPRCGPCSPRNVAADSRGPGARRNRRELQRGSRDRQVRAGWHAALGQARLRGGRL